MSTRSSVLDPLEQRAVGDEPLDPVPASMRTAASPARRSAEQVACVAVGIQPSGAEDPQRGHARIVA